MNDQTKGRLSWAAIVVFGLLGLFCAKDVVKSLDIMAHQQTTPGTLQALGAHGVWTYEYWVSGKQYTGRSQENRKDELAHLKIGDTVEVIYSSTHPSFSTLQDASTVPGTVLVIAIVVAIVYLGHKHGFKEIRLKVRRKPNQITGANHGQR